MSFRHTVSQPTGSAGAPTVSALEDAATAATGAGHGHGAATAGGATAPAGTAAGHGHGAATAGAATAGAATVSAGFLQPQSYNSQLTLGGFINGIRQHSLNVQNLKNVLAELPLKILPVIIALDPFVGAVIIPQVLAILNQLVEYCKNKNVTISYATQSRQPRVIVNHLGQVFTKVKNSNGFQEFRLDAGVSKSAQPYIGSGDKNPAMAEVSDFAESIRYFIEDANIDISEDFDLRNESMYLLAKKPARIYAGKEPFYVSQGNNDKLCSYVVFQLSPDLNGGYLVLTREL